MSKQKTLRVNIEPEADPNALRVTMRIGNQWLRATIRDERAWDAVGILAITSKPPLLMEYFAKAIEAGEAWRKDGIGKPWVKVTKDEDGKE